MTPDVLKVELEPETGRSLLAAKELLSLIRHSGEATGSRREEDLAGLYRATGPAALRSKALRPDSFEAVSWHAEETPGEAARRRLDTGEARGSEDALSIRQLTPSMKGRSRYQPHVVAGDRSAAAGERGSAPRNGEATEDAEAALAPSGEVDVPAWPSGCLPPAGEVGRGQTGPVGQGADLLSAGPYQEAGPLGRSITVIYGDKIDANNYYGRAVDNANTTAVRGGTTVDME